MLEQLLKKYFESDSTAIPEHKSRINADVLSRIESEKPMRKHIGIKPLIIAAMVSAVGLTSVMLTVSASTSEKHVENDYSIPEKITASGYEIYEGSLQKTYREEAESQKIMEEYLDGKMTLALKNGGVIIEKEFDETDVVGYVPPKNMRNSEFTPEELETVKLIEENPETLGLIPIGKSEIFFGGLRIVNRHFENKNEQINGEKVYYAFRRIYTDDPENRLLASIYQGISLKVTTNEAGNKTYFCHKGYFDTVLDVFLDHTEEGCIAEFEDGSRRSTGLSSGYCGGGYYDEELNRIRRTSDMNADNVLDGSNTAFDFSYMFLKSNPYSGVNSNDVPVGTLIAVKDGVQLLD